MKNVYTQLKFAYKQYGAAQVYQAFVDPFLSQSLTIQNYDDLARQMVQTLAIQQFIVLTMHPRDKPPPPPRSLGYESSAQTDRRMRQDDLIRSTQYTEPAQLKQITQDDMLPDMFWALDEEHTYSVFEEGKEYPYWIYCVSFTAFFNPGTKVEVYNLSKGKTEEWAMDTHLLYSKDTGELIENHVVLMSTTAPQYILRSVYNALLDAETESIHHPWKTFIKNKFTTTPTLPRARLTQFLKEYESATKCYEKVKRSAPCKFIQDFYVHLSTGHALHEQVIGVINDIMLIDNIDTFVWDEVLNKPQEVQSKIDDKVRQKLINACIRQRKAKRCGVPEREIRETTDIQTLSKLYAYSDFEGLTSLKDEVFRLSPEVKWQDLTSIFSDADDLRHVEESPLSMYS